MRVETLTRGPLNTHAYLVSDGVSAEALLIDPPEQGEELVDEAERLGLRIVAVLATHSHLDHISGVAGVRSRLPAPFLIGADALESLRDEPRRVLAKNGVAIPIPPEPDRLLRAGNTVSVGALAFSVLDTPGHWRGDISLYEPTHRAVFSGDTIGRGFIFNTNPGCDIALLLHSIQTQLLTLPDDTTIYPGHGPATTVGHERRHNRAARPR